MTKGFDRVEKAIQRLTDRDTMLFIDDKKIGEAVARELKKLPAPKVEIPQREPATYRATIERRGNQMVGAIIEPVKGK
jgi:hypothetical protein